MRDPFDDDIVALTQERRKLEDRWRREQQAFWLWTARVLGAIALLIVAYGLWS